MIHYNTTHKYYILLGIGYNLICYSLPELRVQAKEIYNLDISTILN